MAAIHSAPVGAVRLVRFRFLNSSGRLYAGPYSKIVGVNDAGGLRIKLAKELDLPCDIDLPISDFDVPDNDHAVRRAVKIAAWNLWLGKDVLVGCGWGLGRTGVFLALLYRLDDLVRALLHPDHAPRTTDFLIEALRSQYDRRAVETKSQRHYVGELHLQDIAKLFAVLTKPTVIFDKRFWRA